MIQGFLLVYSPNFDVLSEDGKYQVVTRSYDEANDLLLLNPKKRFPEGTKVLHLSGEKEKCTQHYLAAEISMEKEHETSMVI